VQVRGRAINPSPAQKLRTKREEELQVSALREKKCLTQIDQRQEISGHFMEIRFERKEKSMNWREEGNRGERGDVAVLGKGGIPSWERNRKRARTLDQRERGVARSKLRLRDVPIIPLFPWGEIEAEES